MKTLAVRLKPDQDLRQALKAVAVAHQIQAGFILSAIGSLKQVALRFADQPTSTLLAGRYEMLSLNGTLSVNGMHLHMAIADSNGNTLGGHVGDGCIIYTTAEIAIGEIEELVFDRSLDEKTGFLELEIMQRQQKTPGVRQG